MAKKTKTVQTSDPWAPAQPAILKGLNASTDTYDANQPQLQKYATQLGDTYGRLSPGAEQGIAGTQSLVNDTVGGKYLQGNPYLDGILGKTRQNVTDSVNDQFGPAGRFGSGMHAKILTDELASAENTARYANYDQERNRQIQAGGMAQDLMRGSQGLVNDAASLPWIGVGALNGNVRQASNGYGTTTSKTTQSDPIGSATALGGLGLKAFTTFSDARLKDIQGKVGETPDGLGIYDYTYKGDNTPQTGVLAQEVAQKRPDALGPTVGGAMTVDYGQLAQPTGMFGKQASPGVHMPMGQDQKPAKPKYNDPGGLRERLSDFADTLLAYSGNPIGIAGLQAQGQRRSDAAGEMQYQRHRQDSMADRQADWSHEDDTWRSRQQYEAEHRPEPVAAQTARLAGLEPGTPEWKAALTAAIPGYGYTAPVLDARTAAQMEVAGYRADRSAGLKAQPTYAQTHPKGHAGGGGGSDSGHYEYRMGPNGVLQKRRVN